MHQWLDRAPKGRIDTGGWWRRHGEYNSESQYKGASKDCCALEKRNAFVKMSRTTRNPVGGLPTAAGNPKLF